MELSNYSKFIEGISPIDPSNIRKVYNAINSVRKPVDVQLAWESFCSNMINSSEKEVCQGLAEFNAICEKAIKPKVLNKAEDTEFQEVYPKANTAELLEEQYKEWLSEVSYKSFYKTIASYYDQFNSGDLIISRDFMFQLIKAISSCITHLSIEAEQKNSAILLFETYYDSLINCLNNVVHASTEEDVLASYSYMVDFINLGDNLLSEDDSDGVENIEQNLDDMEI